jgi:AAA15 family ATPase/GTPase
MGDGVWRILGMVLSLARAGGGMLLVDEVDTGMHHTVMTDMWRLVYAMASRLDIQVFATTHSRDCCRALAEVVREADPELPDVTLQRIEPDSEQSVAFSAEEIVVADERGIEVR